MLKYVVSFLGEIFLMGSIKSTANLDGIPGIPKYLGKMEDGCIIHVKDESVAQTIRECADFNLNVKIIVK